jgi:hypothetical protein
LSGPQVYHVITNITSLGNQLSPETFEVLQILKGGYKSGVLASLEEAMAHELKSWTPVIGGNNET